MRRASLYTLQRLSNHLTFTIGFFVGLSSIGNGFTRFTLVNSASGVGLGFGLQAHFSNYVAGLIVVFEESLKVGDFVELESALGCHGIEIPLPQRDLDLHSRLGTGGDWAKVIAQGRTARVFDAETNEPGKKD